MRNIISLLPLGPVSMIGIPFYQGFHLICSGQTGRKVKKTSFSYAVVAQGRQMAELSDHDLKLSPTILWDTRYFLPLL